MRESNRFRKMIWLVSVLILDASGSPLHAAETDRISVAIQCDPAKVVGSDTCTKCHENEMRVWHETPHFATFDTLHRKPEAKAIADKLGLGSVKRNETCVKCHYTQQQVDTRVRVVSGVSCESCHGAAKEWLELHADYGGPNLTKADETPEHRQQRVSKSVAAGMNNPANLYLIARQCLGCHTTPNEELVNTGGHNAGSREFELVAWSQGMVRHNFLQTNGTSNAVAAQEELRAMFVVGLMADLEASLRATAKATTKGLFGTTSAKRAATLKQKLYYVSQQIENPDVEDAVQAALSVPLKLNRSQELEAAAATVGKAARAFAETVDGSTLGAIDPLLPSPEQYRGKK